MQIRCRADSFSYPVNATHLTSFSAESALSSARRTCNGAGLVRFRNDRGRLRARLKRQRQSYDEFAALSASGYAPLSALDANQPLHERQPDYPSRLGTGHRLFRLRKEIEDVRQKFGSDPDPCIAHAQ